MTPRQRYEAIARNVLKIANSEAPEGTVERYLQSEGLNYDQLTTALKATDDKLDFSDVTGQAGEFFKGIIPGAAGLVETAATGIGAAFDDETEQSIRESVGGVTESIREKFTPTPGYEETVGRKFGEAFGSFVPFLAFAPFGIVGKAAVTALATGAGAGEARLRAEEAEATPEQRATATAQGIPVGLLELVAPARILKKLDTGVIESGVQRVGRALETGGIEAATEAAAGFAQNAIAKSGYKPEQELVEGIGEEAAYGGAVGALAQGLFDLAMPRARKTEPTKPTQRPTEEGDQLALTALPQPTEEEKAQSALIKAAETRVEGPITKEEDREEVREYVSEAEQDLARFQRNKQDLIEQQKLVSAQERGPIEGQIQQVDSAIKDLKGQIDKRKKILPESERKKGFVPKIKTPENQLGLFDEKGDITPEATPEALKLLEYDTKIRLGFNPEFTKEKAQEERKEVQLENFPDKKTLTEEADKKTKVRRATPRKPKNTDKITRDFIKTIGPRPSAFFKRYPDLEGKSITDPAFYDALDTYAKREGASPRVSTKIEEFLPKIKGASDDRRRKATVKRKRTVTSDAAPVATRPSPETVTAPVGEGVDTSGVDTRPLDVREGQGDFTLTPQAPVRLEEKSDFSNLLDFKKATADARTSMTLEDFSRAYAEDPSLIRDQAIAPRIQKEFEKEKKVAKLEQDSVDTIKKDTIFENNPTLNLYQPYVERLSSPAGATEEQKVAIRKEYEESQTAEQKAFDKYVRKFVDEGGKGKEGLNKRRLRLLAGDLLRPQKRARGSARKVYNKLNKAQKRYVDNSAKEIQDLLIRGPIRKLTAVRAELINAELDLRDVNKELKENPDDIELQGEVGSLLEDIKEIKEVYEQIKKEVREVSPTEEKAVEFIEKVENVRVTPKFKGKEAERAPRGRRQEPTVTEAPEFVRRVEGFVKELTKGWKNAPKIQVVNGFPDLIKITEEGQYNLEKLNRLSPEQQRNIKGIFDSNTNTVYVIAANNTNKRDVLKTILHESIGHYGLRSILGKDYKETMNRLYNTDKQIQDAADQLMREQGLSKEEAVEELIAVAVENTFVGRRPEAGQEGFMAALKKLIQRTLKAIREAMQNLGFPVLSNTEVQDIIAQSANYVMNNKVDKSRKATVGTETGAERFMFRDASAMADDMLVSSFLGMNVSNSKGPTPGFFSRISSAFFETPKFLSGVARKLEAEIAYKGSSVERKSRKAYNNETRDALGAIRPDILMLQTEHADSLATAVMKLGRLVFNKVSGFEAVEGDASLTGVFEKVGRLGEELGDIKKAEKLVNDALIIIRAKDLKGKDIIPDELLPTKEQIEAGEAILKRYDIIDEIHQEFTSFKNGLIDNMVDSGRISKEKATQWKEAIGYVPWNRIKESEAEVFNQSPSQFFKGLGTKEIGRLKGSKDEINSVLENMVGLTFWMVKSSMRNHAALSIVDNWVKHDLGATKLTKVPDKEADNIVTVYRNGKEEYYAFDDILDVYAFKGLEVMSGPIIDAMTSLSNLLRKGVTATPQFAISQLFQDSYRAMTLSGTDNPFKTAFGVINPLSYGSVRLNQNETVEQLKRYGIVGAYDFMPGREKDEVLTAFNLQQKGRTRKFFEFFENFSIASDANLRRAVFQQTLEETKSEQFPDGDVLAARIAAQEIINFKRQGANKYISVLRQIVPFMNAYIQGMSVYLRTMQGVGVSQREKYIAQRLFLKAGYKLATLSTIYTFLVAEDEEYQQQNEYVKDKNFIIPGTGVKLPVAPEIGFLFKVIPERSINYVISQGTARPEDAQTFRENLARAAFDSFSSPNLTPQAFKTPAEVFLNYSFFRDAPVVPRGLENVASEEQFTSSTSELAKMFGQFTGLSPIKTEYLIRGMTGIAGGTLIDLTNVISSKVMGRREYNLYELPAFKTFAYDKIPSGDKSEYYKFRDEVGRVTDTVNLLINRQDTEGLIKYLEEDENAKLYILGQSVRAVQTQLSDTRALKRIINEDKSISPEEKTRLVNEIDKLNNDIIRIINIPYIKKNILGR